MSAIPDKDDTAIPITFTDRLLMAWVRTTTAWPGLKSVLPFMPLLFGWWLTAELEVFPKAFFPGPGDVAASFVSLVYKGILPDYLADSLARLAVGTAAGVAIAIPLGVLIGMSRRAYT
ncbi:MAG: hypothetical protein LH624_19480, partial [Cryobacterium sp.]|nr:hypothetical protein [Cryobacterium sp.]